MAVKFRCEQCGAWLEVDDEHVGGQAICPFCQKVTGVPPAREVRTSADGTLPSAATDESMAGQSPHTLGPAGWADRQERPHEQAATVETTPHEPFGTTAVDLRLPSAAKDSRVTWLGPIAFATSAAGLVLFLISIITIGMYLQPYMPVEGPLTEQDLANLQQQHATLMKEKPWLAWTTMGGMILSVVGLTLSAVSLGILQNPRARLWAWAGLVTSGGTILCICSGLLFYFQR